MFAFQYALFHPSETGEKEVMDFYIRNLKETRLSLILENIRGYDPQEFLDLYRRFKDSLGDQLWGICLDVPHAHLTSQDWESYYRLLKSHIRVIHLSDCRDGEDKHLPFGMGGELSLKSIIFFLKRQKFEGFLNFEILPPSMPGIIGIIKMIQQVRNLQEAVEKP